MRKKNLLTIGIWLSFGMTAIPVNAQVSNDNEDGVNRVDQHVWANDFVPGQVLVKFKDESTIQVQRTAKGQFRAASINKVDQLLRSYGVKDMEKLFPNEVAKPKASLGRKLAPNGTMVQEKNLDKVFWVKTNIQGSDSTLQLIEQLKALPEVEYAEPNYKVYITADVPTELYDNQQVSGARAKAPVVTETTATTICPNPSSNPLYFRQYGITQQKIQKLWNKPIINTRRPVIAILDTGVDITHPDLEDNIWTNTQEANGEKAYDDDGNTIVDDVHGWNFVDNYYDFTDRNGHGTHVAGIAAAADNNIGIVGANPLALIMPVKVMNDRGEGDQATIARGIDYAAANGADIINMSLGSNVMGSYMKNAIDNAYQTAIIVASAGNYGVDIYTNKPGIYGTQYPAAYYLVLGVEASGSNLQRASFSNYDPDGPIYSEDGIDGRNYEVQVPGDKIYSTLPGGKYNQLSGTSMSAPLFAGAISALQMVKDYPSKDVLFGDLIHLNADFEKIYSDETPRLPKIDLVSLEVDDNVDGNTNIDGQVDVGETIKFTPVLRNTWVNATDINLQLDVDPIYSSFVDIENPQVPFGYSLSAYGRSAAQTPIRVRFADNIGDNTRIKFVLTVSWLESSETFVQDVYVTVNNIVKISGLITEDKTLTAERHYLVTSNLAIPDGITLTIEAGTIVEFDKAGLSNDGVLNINGTPQKPIILKSRTSELWGDLMLGNSIISYCNIYNLNCGSSQGIYNFENCNFIDCKINFFGKFKLEKCTFTGGAISYTYGYGNYNAANKNCFHSNNTNFINISTGNGYTWMDYPTRMGCDNIINALIGPRYSLYSICGKPMVLQYETLPYLGTSRENRARFSIGDIETGCGYGRFNLNNMPIQPYAEAHGIVWKVVVNDYDAQDQYDELDPLGVGKHKFEVYFNRPMNVAVAPQVSFGVREPYTQHAVDEDGSWSADSLVYTVYKTITGRTQSDGVNRIYVRGAEDNEYFECPYEKTRFNINIQTAGALATGFAAEEKMGRVELAWTSQDNDFSDAMGFNLYRYTIDNNNHADTVRINNDVILVKEVTTEDVNTPEVQNYEYIDYDVTPGTTYYYFYKVLSTDLQEYDVSNVVAATPLTTIMGDANGSGDVSVGDVISAVDYVLGENPKPFIFEAADINTDNNVDVLDVIGIIQIILNQPGESRLMIENMAEAVYTIENGMLYIETPVELSGLQVQLSLPQPLQKEGSLKATAEMKGFEVASTWLMENDYRMLAYSFGSKTLKPGKHAIMTIGDADITSLRLADVDGHNVVAIPGEATVIKDAMGSKVMTTKGVYNLSGQKVAGKDNSKLRKGVYIIDGQKIVK